MAHLRFYLLALAILALASSPPARAQVTTQKIAGQPSDPPKAPSEVKPRSAVTITNPADNALVENDGSASGTFDSSIKDDIWVFIFPTNAPSKGWPQSPDATHGAPAVLNRQKNRWSTPVSFGGPAQNYEIAVYTAKRAASTRIGRLLQAWASANNYPGMELKKLTKLKGLVERHRITVRKPKGA